MKPWHEHYSPWLYGLFTLMGISQMVWSDLGDGMASLGIALAFDPFEPDRHWKERPWWQKAWLLVHVAVVFGLLIFNLFIKD